MSDPKPWLEGTSERRDLPGTPATPAATVVVVRDAPGGPELLLVERGSGAFGGMWAYPGGRVEPGDAADAVALPSDPPAYAAEVAVARAAAVRETAEECGLALEASSLVAQAFWVPPASAPRRFATWFFVAPLAAASGPVVVDRGELRDHRWMTPAAAIDARDAGEITMAPPTWVTAWQLLDATSAAGAAAGRGVRRFVTRLVRREDGTAVLMWEGDAGYETEEPDLDGPRRRLTVSETEPWRAETPAGVAS